MECCRRHHRRMSLWTIVWLGLLLSSWDDLFPQHQVRPTALADATPVGDDEHDEFVQQVLEEDAWHHDEDNPYHEDPPSSESPPQGNDKRNKEEERLRRQQEEERLKQQAEAERLQRQAAEEAFKRELAQLPDEQQKLLRQKRRRDGRIVQRILRAHQRQDYYAVLGLRWWFFPEGICLLKGRGRGKDGPPKKFNLKDAFLKFTWPDVIVGRISARTVQQKYRLRAVQVHPDKNRDPRTEQAFVAVQDAAETLTDPHLRQQYEQERRVNRQTVRQAWKDRYHKLINTTLRPLWVMFHRIAGPMAVPIIVLVALMF